MPTSLVGRIIKPGRRGVTLIELLVVTAIIAVIVAVTSPSVGAGIDAVRLNTSTTAVAAFLNAASTYAERHELPVELAISAKTLVYVSTLKGSRQEFDAPQGITFAPVAAAESEDASGVSRWLFMPGGAIPAVGVRLSNQHGGQRTVKLDPMTGFPRVEGVQPAK